nr:E3 ubiquitin-protein ligase TRIM71-like [Pocillopora verrucosa]
MDIKTLLNNLHEEVSCSVCMNTFTDPKTLPCLHVFCLHCLNGILRTSGHHDIIVCPECRKEIHVPRSGNLEDLPTNFRINSLLDVLAIKECNATEVRCGNCEESSSQSFYCFQCCAFWCEANCIIHHNGIKANKEHRVLALKDFKDQDFENVLKRPVFCRSRGHEGKELEFFCKDCCVAICHSCVATTHDGHAKMLLEEAANDRKLLAKSAIENQKKTALEYRREIARLDSDCAKIQEHVASVKKSVQQFVDSLMAVIEAQKQETFDDLDNRAAESIHRLKIQRSEIEKQVKITETGIEATEVILQRNISAEIMQSNKIREVTFQGQVESAHPPIGNQSIADFEFVRNQRLFDHAWTDRIGFVKVLPTSPTESSASGEGISKPTTGLEANIMLTTRNAKGEQCYEKRDYVTVEIKNQDGHDCATETRVQDNKDGSYKISYFAKETGKYGVSVKVNGEHIRNSPFAAEVKPRQFRPVLSFGKHGSAKEDFTYPWAAAVNERDEIVITDSCNNRVQVFSSDGTYLRSFGSKGNKEGEFNSPKGIAIDNESGIIFIADTANHRIQLFSEQGEFLNKFGVEGNLDHQLSFPYGLSIGSDGNCIVGDSGNNKIKLFSRTGQFQRSIGSEGSFTFPFYCIQYKEYLIASDFKEDCIKVFDKAGHFLYKFGKRGTGDGEFNGPYHLSINKAEHLMVCDENNHRIQLFEVNGNFIGKFGSKGKKIGRFSRPLSSAVLSDGRIVVTEFYNHRVQIFE